MPIEITVSPPGLTISQGRTFVVTSESGEIDSATEQGIFAIDTRFINYYQLYINQHPWKLVTSSPLSFYAARIHMTNPTIVTELGTIPEHTLRFTLDRIVEDGITEELSIANHSGRAVRFLLELALRSDFADIFEVKMRSFIQRGRIQTTWDEQQHILRTSYTHLDFHRAVSYVVPEATVPIGYANGRISFEVALEHGAEWRGCGEMVLEHGQRRRRLIPRTQPRRITMPTFADIATRTPADEQPITDFDERQARWRARCMAIETPNQYVYSMYSEAVDDMGALRIYDMDVSDEAWVPAAGVPWFVTLFGRDSLIVALQNMPVAPGFARGALKRLAEYQATQRDDWRDAQPGKILHEIRFGELAHFNKIPFTPYYGTADATILFLITLDEAYRWTGDRELLHEYREVAEQCLMWIDNYGDLDGDGYQEYKTFSPLGYENQGWKDAADAVVYADGTQVPQPKGLCELQGYVYDAKLRMAEMFEVLGDVGRARALREQAATLRQRFNDVFWMEDEGCYAYGLDPRKRQITSVTSNAGHCLWSGIADPEKAIRTAHRLLQPDMWSGWGIRTITSENPAYNPFSYHIGSVWPHDNGIIAAGFKRYGLAAEANFVIRGVFDAARRFAVYRLPEIYAGIERSGRISDFPVLYPGGANIPQAWASGAVFMMLQTILGLRADAPHDRLYVKPTLPDWLPALQLHHLNVGPTLLDLRFWREGTESRWEVVGQRPRDDAPLCPITVLDDPTFPMR